MIGWEYKPEGGNPLGLGFPDFFDFQHEALLRLLDLQRSRFGRPALPRATGGVYIDHSLVKIIDRDGDRLTIDGTGTLKPVHYDGSSVHGPDPYWQMERFVFTSAGELLSRDSRGE